MDSVATTATLSPIRGPRGPLGLMGRTYRARCKVATRISNVSSSSILIWAVTMARTYMVVVEVLATTTQESNLLMRTTHSRTKGDPLEMLAPFPSMWLPLSLPEEKTASSTLVAPTRQATCQVASLVPTEPARSLTSEGSMAMPIRPTPARLTTPTS